MRALILLLLLLLLQLFSTASGAKPVKHVVMFTLRSEASKAQQKQIQTELLELPKKIPEIQEYELGVDLKLKGGQNHPAGKNRVICWSATFKNKDDYETYDSCVAHKEFLALLKPLVEPGSRAAIQYELPEKK